MSKEITDQIIEEIKEDVKEEELKVLSSGATILDLILGGGLASGKIINIVGDKSAGKTLFAIEIIASIKRILKDKLKIFYDDCESGFTFDEKELFGLKIIEDDQDNSASIEDMKFNLEKKLDKLKDDEYLIYVVDSLDGLSSEAELEREEKEKKARANGKVLKLGTYGMEKQKYLKKIFRLLAAKIKKKNCILIIISQVIANIGVMFGAKFVRTGGKALDFYACHAIWLAEVEKMRKKELQIGMRVKVKCEKNKLNGKLRQGFIDVLYDYGVDNITSNINYLYDLLTPLGKYKAKKIIYNEIEYTPAGLVQHIEENNLEQELAEMVIKKWNDLEDSISSKDRKRKY